MSTYKVTAWPKKATAIEKTIDAANYREAAAKSGLAKPGLVISVEGPRKNIRYRVGMDGRLLELATYDFSKSDV